MATPADDPNDTAMRFRQVYWEMTHTVAPVATDITRWLKVTMEMLLWVFDRVLVDRFARRSMVSAKDGALDIHLKDINLHEAVYEALLDLGCKTIGDVVALSPVEILSAPGLGKMRWEQLKGALRACGVESWPGDFKADVYHARRDRS